MSKQHPTSREERLQLAELLKERIYSTITLLAVLATLWRGAEHVTPLGAAGSILATAVALWLAIAIASRMSYHVIHGASMPARELGQMLAVRKALLAPAIAPILFIGLSVITPLSLETALFIGMLSLLASFAIFSLIAGRRTRATWYEIAISSGLEIALGIGVILLKITVGH